MMDIQQIRRDIEGDLEDARFLAFMTLYTSDEPEAQHEINHILELRDPILKLLFLRFLTHVPERRAVDYICRMMEDENPVVAEAARHAFEQNRFEGRLDVILPLMKSASPSAQRFAIEVLSRASRVDAVETILSLMQDADEPLLLVILTALRFMPTSASIVAILNLLSDPRDEIRFRAALVCGELVVVETKQLREPLLMLLKDASAHVRRAALWGLRREPVKSDDQLLIRVATEDLDPMVRQEAIIGLARFPSNDVIQQLLKMLVTEKNRWVSLKCESVLMGMPSQRLVKGLNQAMTHRSGEIRNKAILLAADYQRGSDHYFKFLLKNLTSAKSDKERLTYLEALGTFGSAKAVPVLLMYIYGSPIVAYVAMTALLKVNPDPDAYLSYLEKPEGSPLIKQIVLRYLVRRPLSDGKYRNRVLNCLTVFLRGENINMRYLAAQVLVQITGEKAQEALLDTLEYETDPASLQLLRSSLIDFFTKDPQGFVDLLSRRRADATAFNEMGLLLQGVIWTAKDILAQLPALLSPDIAGDDIAYRHHCVTWLSAQILQGRVSLEGVLQALCRVPQSDEVVQGLAAILVTHPDVRLVISADTSRRWLASGNDKTQRAIIDLMSLAQDTSSIPVLVSVICNDGMKLFHPNAVRALGRITEAAHD